MLKSSKQATAGFKGVPSLTQLIRDDFGACHEHPGRSSGHAGTSWGLHYFPVPLHSVAKDKSPVLG